MTTDPITPHAIKGSAYLVAPSRHRHHGWFHRRRTSRRGRFELALIAGGGLALLLAATMPGQRTPVVMLLLAAAGVLMTVIARMVGPAPVIVAAVFSALVIALTDPMWTLGATIADFTLAEECEATFATFLLAAMIGSALRRRHRSAPKPRALWSATPPRDVAAVSPSALGER